MAVQGSKSQYEEDRKAAAVPERKNVEKIEKTYHPNYKKDNVRQIRRYLGLSQQDFLDRFMRDEEGKLRMSVASLSNLESKGGAMLNEVVLAVSEALSLDSVMFSLEPANFLEQADRLLSGREDIQAAERKGNAARLVDRLTMYFADEIFAGNLKRGDRVESDRELAQKLGVGRSAVREALKVLDVMGMIDIRPGQGSYISGREDNFFVVPLSWSLFLNSAQTESILQVRDILEGKAAELAASCQDEAKVARLGDIYHRIRVAYEQRDYASFLNLDVEFHSCIADCSGNPVIYSIIQTIRNLMKRVSGTGMMTEEQIHQIYEEHLKVYGCIISGNGEGARAAMEEHMEHSLQRYSYQ